IGSIVARSVSSACLSFHVDYPDASPPVWLSNSPQLSNYHKFGHPSIVTFESAQMGSGQQATGVFLAPLIRTLPLNGRPPSINIFSITKPPTHRLPVKFSFILLIGMGFHSLKYMALNGNPLSLVRYFLSCQSAKNF